MRISVGEKITILRKRNNLSVAKLAEQAEISVATIISYEKRKTIPSVDNAIKIAMALNVPIDDLISFSTSEEESVQLCEIENIKAENPQD